VFTDQLGLVFSTVFMIDLRLFN